ncbi:YciI family protein [Saccharothrix yanglingensis]|uniref:YCII-related domain-containing protein n=1 Tax=Saccharothrix yanglingensis TaxID=659496 RepID=A0ABU0X4B7_9PSEU|nr:YciI family protein [Saccharothrix yanglingensis]MDQ2586959.1 hypothetical protein [Saccharothrix yanglingensis]
MRFMVIVKATEASEAGTEATEQELVDMLAFNEELVKAGVLLAGEGLYPSSRGARVFFDGDERTVVDGPFTETKELIAGFWLLDVKSLEECVEWVKRVPNTSGGHSQIEVRQVIESEDFANAPQELVDRENELRAQQGYPTTRG